MVALDSGSAPTSGTLLVDRNDSTHTKFHAGIGGFARVLSATGRGGIAADHRGWAQPHRRRPGRRRVHHLLRRSADGLALSGATGYTSLGFRLRDNSRPAAERTVAAIRTELRATTSFRAFDDMPVIQDPGGYPGQVGVREARRHVHDHHAARSADRARARVQHDVDADRGANRRDRRDESDRRPAPRHPAAVSPHDAAVRRAWRRRGRDPRGRVREPPRWVLCRSRVRDQRAMGGVGADRDRERHRRADRSAARGAPRRPSSRASAAGRGASRLRLRGWWTGPAGCAAQALHGASTRSADRASRSRSTQASQSRHGAAGRTRRRHAPRAALPRCRHRQDHGSVV